jgi:stress response protein SCP2
LVLALSKSPVAQAWVTPNPSVRTRSSLRHSLDSRPTTIAKAASFAATAACRRPPSRVRTVLSAEQNDDNDGDGDGSDRTTSFAKADQSLMDEADKKRMEEMGDFDLNADVRTSTVVMLQSIVMIDTV